MIDVLGFVAYLILPLVGVAVWRLDGVRRLSLDGRLAIAGATGALATALLMAAMALVGLHWSRTRLVIGLLLLIAGGLAGARRPESAVPAPRPAGQRFALVCAAIFLAITAYGLLTARETSGDLLFFWGPKGVHFYRGGTIDVDYLRNPNSFLAHRDYPPLLPLLFAWSNSISHEFSWWGAVLLSGLCLAGIVAVVRSHARDNLAALLAAAILAWGFGRAQLAGGADPLLLLFETVTVAALLFLPDVRSQTVVAAIGMAGAVFTKVEGASFVVAVVLALLLERLPIRRIATMILPACLLLGGWLTFLIRAELLDTYRGPGPLTFQYLRQTLTGTLAAASYDALWIPWIAPLAIVVLGDFRRARLPLTIAALSLGATLSIYLRSPIDPMILWIPSSAHRVLLTPLLMVLLAAAAAHAPTLLPASRRGEEV